MTRIAEMGALAELHSPRRRMWKDGRWRDDMCSRCRTTHPCPTARVLTELREAQEKLEAVARWRRGSEGYLALDRILKGGE